jgi:hypothetical protein
MEQYSMSSKKVKENGADSKKTHPGLVILARIINRYLQGNTISDEDIPDPGRNKEDRRPSR